MFIHGQNRQRRRFSWFVAIVLALALVWPICEWRYRKRILPQIRLSGVALGGLPAGEAEKQLNAKLESAEADHVLELFHGERVWPVRAIRLGARFDVKASVRLALNAGRTGPWWSRWTAGLRGVFFPRPMSLNMVWTLDSARWDEFFGEIAEDVYQEPRNAVFNLQTSRIEPESRGYTADSGETMVRVIQALAQGEKEIPIAVRPLLPTVTTRDLALTRAGHVLAAFTTAFRESDQNRSHNIALAAARINGTILKPGEVFSFNGIVGQTAASEGFRPAPEIMNGELVPGIGGGVCQVATTLYNAVLLAGLEILERRPHSLIPAYIPPGRDATVYFGRIDFRFRNTMPFHVIIQAGVRDKELHISMLGGGDPVEYYQLSHRIIEQLEPPVEIRHDAGLAPGEERPGSPGSPGYRVEVWRQSSAGARERVSLDIYPPKPKIILMGADSPDTAASTPESANPGEQDRSGQPYEDSAGEAP